ncbi:MAG: T9SS type A sorting domain-containing protein, partial [Bacteroidales bacterium]
FTATPTNGGTTPSYIWFVNGVNVGAANSPVFTSSVLNDGENVYCTMGSSEGCVTNSPAQSNTVTITVNPELPVDVLISADNNPVCDGEPVTFTATPTNEGATPSYDWLVNGVSVGAPDTDTYTVSTLANGDVVEVVLTSSATCATNNPATSNAVNVIENALPTPTITGTLSYCAGNSTTLDAGAGYSSYSWSSGGNAQTEAVTIADNPITVTVENANGCFGTSPVVNVTEIPLPVLNLPDTALIACINEPFEYTLETTYDDVIWPDGETDQTYSYTYTDIMTDTLIVTVGNSGCFVTDTLFVDVQDCNKITENRVMHVSLYPNPTTGKLNINISEYHGKLILQIMSIEGSQILDKDFYSDGKIEYSFDMTPFIPGIYVVRVLTENNLYFYRIVKQ